MTTYQEARSATAGRPSVASRSALLRVMSAASSALGGWWSRNRFRARALWASLIGFLFDAAGVAVLSAAGWQLHISAGLAVIGIGVLIIGHDISERVRHERQG